MEFIRVCAEYKKLTFMSMHSSWMAGGKYWGQPFPRRLVDKIKAEAML
jgi:hypothetical protein